MPILLLGGLALVLLAISQSKKASSKPTPASDCKKTLDELYAWASPDVKAQLSRAMESGDPTLIEPLARSIEAINPKAAYCLRLRKRIPSESGSPTIPGESPTGPIIPTTPIPSGPPTLVIARDLNNRRLGGALLTKEEIALAKAIAEAERESRERAWCAVPANRRRARELGDPICDKY